MEANIQIRVYEDSDYETIAQWYAARHPVMPFVPRELLPPIGQIAFADGEDLAAMWLYLAAGSPVAFIEYAVSKPGVPVSLAAKALMTIEEVLGSVAVMFNCRLLVAHVRPAFTRYMKRTGWTGGASNLVAMYKAIKMEVPAQCQLLQQ